VEKRGHPHSDPGFSVLIWVAVRSYKDAPPIPENVVGTAGTTLLPGPISSGATGVSQARPHGEWHDLGHGAYLGPDFSATYLHALAVDAAEFIARENFKRSVSQLTAIERAAVNAEASALLKQNRYNPENQTLSFTAAEEASYPQQIERWKAYFEDPLSNRGLMNKQVQDPEELRQLTRLLRMDRVGLGRQPPGQALFLYEQLPLRSPRRE